MQGPSEVRFNSVDDKVKVSIGLKVAKFIFFPYCKEVIKQNEHSTMHLSNNLKLCNVKCRERDIPRARDQNGVKCVVKCFLLDCSNRPNISQNNYTIIYF